MARSAKLLPEHHFALDSFEPGVAFQIGSRGNVDFFRPKPPRFALDGGDHGVEIFAFGGGKRVMTDRGGFCRQSDFRRIGNAA